MFCRKLYDKSRQRDLWIIEWELVCCPEHSKAFRTVWVYASKIAWNRMCGMLSEVEICSNNMFKKYDNELKTGVKV